MPFDGRVITCDLSEDSTAVGKRYWEEAAQAHKIEARLGPALDSLDALIAQGRAGDFDFAFIDADKERCTAYFERCLQLVRRSGLIAIDNTLWEGKVADSDVTDEDTEAIRRFNEKLKDDERVSLSLVPIGDGLTLARKR